MTSKLLSRRLQLVAAQTGGCILATCFSHQRADPSCTAQSSMVPTRSSYSGFSRLQTLQAVSDELLVVRSHTLEESAETSRTNTSTSRRPPAIVTPQQSRDQEKKYARKIYAITKFLLLFLEKAHVELFHLCKVRMSRCHIAGDGRRRQGANDVARCIERTIRPLVGEKHWVWAYSEVIKCRHLCARRKEISSSSNHNHQVKSEIRDADSCHVTLPPLL
jgi:hypothetical protein